MDELIEDQQQSTEKLLRYYRHDFLNILQVVGGLAQLNKGERLHDYIRQASTEVRQFGLFITCGDSRLAVLLLEGFLQRLNGPYVLRVEGRLPLLAAAVLRDLPAVFTALAESLAGGRNQPPLTVCLAGGSQPQLRLYLPAGADADWCRALAAAASCGLAAGTAQGGNEFFLLLDKGVAAGKNKAGQSSEEW